MRASSDQISKWNGPNQLRRRQREESAIVLRTGTERMFMAGHGR